MKRIKTISIILLSICLTAVTSCDLTNKKTNATPEEKAKEEKTLSFSLYEIKKEIPLVDTEYSPKYDIEISMQIAESNDKAVAENINRAIICQVLNKESGDIKSAIDNFIKEEEVYYSSMKNDYINEHDVMEYGESRFDHYHHITGRYKDNGDGVINYTTISENYKGGAHGSYVVTLQNFDAATGREITLNDLIKEGSEGDLSDALMSALIKQKGVKGKNELLDMGYFLEDGIYPSLNFTIGKDSITFYYNAYDIAPYAMGHTQVTLSKQELKKILK